MRVFGSANNAADGWTDQSNSQNTMPESPGESSLFALIGGGSFHSDNGSRKIRGANTDRERYAPTRTPSAKYSNNDMSVHQHQAQPAKNPALSPGGRGRDIRFAEKDEALRQDVHALGIMIGELLIEQGGKNLYDAVETARQFAIEAREGDPAATENLNDLVRQLSAPEAQEFIKAFSAYFQVVNSAEQVHRIRRRRAYLKDAAVRQPLAFDETAFKLQDAGLSLQEVGNLLEKLEIEPVFTAHPTTTTRRTILRKQQNIVQRLIDMQNPTLTPQESRVCFEDIREDVTAIWQTEENPTEEPTVFDELEHTLFFLTDVIYRIIPSFYEALHDGMREAYGSAADQLRLPTLVRFGSWVGGNLADDPETSARIIRETVSRHRSLILELYYRECLALAEKLSQSSNRVAYDQKIDARIGEYGGQFPNARGSIPSRHQRMPYRILLRLMAERLRSTYDDDVYPYESVDQFITDLELIADSLEAHHGANAGLFAVRRLIRRADTFGFYFLTLDIHEDTDELQRVVGQSLGEADWANQSAEYRVKRISQALDKNESAAPHLDNESKRMLSVYQSIAFCQRKYGRRAIGPFIVSKFRGVEDALAVILLAGWSDLRRRDGAIAIDIAPMFDTVHQLTRAPRIMQEILSNPAYRQHLKARENQQTVMVGNSEYSADGSFVSARWGLQWAQMKLVELFDRENVEYTIVHGRSGEATRGGQAEGTAGGRLRATEHGEVVNERFGLRGIAPRSLEQAFSAVAIATALPRETAPEENTEWTTIMNLIAVTSRDAYKNLVFESDRFPDYFRQATPIDVIEHMRIGRQSDRPNQDYLAGNTRTLPWTFAWTLSRYLLPSWYGLGAGLTAAIDTYGAHVLIEMNRSWVFFQHMLEDAETALAIADLGIARCYSSLAGKLHNIYFPLIEAEFDRSVSAVLAVKQQKELLEFSSTLRRSIRLRNPYVDPMSLLQVDLLQRWRAADSDDEQLLDALLASVNGIARGLHSG